MDKTTLQQIEIEVEEVIMNLCNYNEDLVDAEQEEDYEKCSAIKTLIDLYITSKSQIISTISGNSVKEVVFHLTEQSNFLREQIHKMDKMI